MNKVKKELLRKFKRKHFAKSKKFRTFAEEDEPTALAFTDFSKPIPPLKGKDAERFIRIMEENERKAEERTKIPPTKEELENKLNWMKLCYDFEKRQLEENEKEIKELEAKIKDFKNGKTEEE
jgi:hypothetical protein